MNLRSKWKNITYYSNCFSINGFVATLKKVIEGVSLDSYNANVNDIKKI